MTVEANTQTLPLLTIEIKVVENSVLAIPRMDGGDAEETRTGPLDASPRRVERINLLSDLLRMAMDESRQDTLQQDLYLRLLRVVGEELFDLLFQNGVRQLVLENLQKARLRELRLRLNLSFLEGNRREWLASLPWEYVHTPLGDESLGKRGEFLSRATELMLSRRLEVKGKDLGDDARPIPVLLVCASPTAPSPEEPALPKVVPGNMRKTLEALEEDGFIKLETLIDENPPHPEEAVEDYEWKCTRERFIEKVKSVDPVLIHFIGHGQCLKGHGQLAFSRSNGAVDWVSDEKFARDATRRNVKAIFLQACDSARTDPYVAFSGVASELAGRGIPAVIGMQYRVHADTAEVFAEAFYSALASDLPIDVAVKAGRDALSENADVWDQLCFGLPVLYLSKFRAISQRRASFRDKELSTVSTNGGDGWRGACPECGAEFGPDDLYCGLHGHKLPPYCRGCGRIFEGEPDPYCRHCGTPTAAAPYDDHGPAEEDTLESVPLDVAEALEGPSALP